MTDKTLEELRDQIAAVIWDHLRPIEDTTPIADAILAIPEIAAALEVPAAIAARTPPEEQADDPD